MGTQIDLEVPKLILWKLMASFMELLEKSFETAFYEP